LSKYEGILNKIAPTFYNLVQYNEYFEESQRFIDHYLAHAEKVPINSMLHFPQKSNYYSIRYISTYYPFWDKIAYKKAVMLVINDKIRDVAYTVNLGELIVNMVINKFSADIERGIIKFNDYDINPTNIFIALVGKDMYDTIRTNIR